MVKYYNQFLKEIQAIKPYLIEFDKDGFIKPKIYLENYIVKSVN